jgi:hypothetical protein
VAACFNFMNRMAEGLGVEPEAGWAREESDATNGLER